MIKRGFDITVATVGLLIMTPLMAIVALLLSVTSGRPIIFSQRRVGLKGRLFLVYKFRTMNHGDGKRLVTAAVDDRVTPIGNWLRRYKLDELPQLFNVLKGDMSLVGPRPEVPKYVELFQAEYAKILTVRPGITDPASIRFRNESALLTSVDAEQVYTSSILPMKIEDNLDYVNNHTFAGDIVLIAKTVAAIWGGRETEEPSRP